VKKTNESWPSLTKWQNQVVPRIHDLTLFNSIIFSDSLFPFCFISLFLSCKLIPTHRELGTFLINSELFLCCAQGW
jgi:hypothetical protein